MKWLCIVALVLAACDGGTTAGPAPAPAVLVQAPVALAVVVNNQEIFAGNDQYERDPDAAYQGAYPNIATVFEQAAPAKFFPRGSLGTVIGYSTGTKVLVEMGPIDRIRGAAFDQREARGRIGTDLVLGIEHGLEALVAANAARKLMIVIGDGHDTNNDAATSRLEKLRAEAAQARVEMYPLLHSGHCHYSVAATVFGVTRCASSLDALDQELRTILAR